MIGIIFKLLLSLLMIATCVEFARDLIKSIKELDRAKMHFDILVLGLYIFALHILWFFGV